MISIPDNAPSVSVSIEYGKYVEDFDVDVEGITKYLEERGISDDAIANMEINFSSEQELEDGIVTYGAYNREQDRLTISHASDIQEAARIGYSVPTEVRNIFLNKTVIHELEHKIAYHDGETDPETSRYLKNSLLKRFKKPSLTAFATSSAVAYGPVTGEFLSRPDFYGFHPLRILGGAAVASTVLYAMMKRSLARGLSYDEYLAKPEEIRAREAEEKYFNQFVTFKPKYVDEVTPERIAYEDRTARQMWQIFDSESQPND